MDILFMIYLGVGKILLFFGNKFAEMNELDGFIGKLLTCGLCGGFWVYTLLSFLLGEVYFRELFYVPILSQVASGAISSLLVQLISVGWKAQFETIIIE